ncbi:MAG: flagellar hook capping family protein [Proteobacteria bacterium]|nr:flagellar hook capping family protein [Pseudomonadota bacterium]
MPSVSSSTLSALATSTGDAKKKAADTYNQFLILLTTQLKNQDPLDPMESQEFTNQLVQFSQVEQAIIGNEKLDSMLNQHNSNQIGQSIGYIGKDVYFKGNTVHNEGHDFKIGYAIDGVSKDAKLRVIDKNNQVIRTLNIPTGTLSGNVTWDGKDEFGAAVALNENYTLRLDALNAANEPLKSYTGVPAHVEGVETLDGVLYLALNGDRRVEATSVLSVTEPDGA